MSITYGVSQNANQVPGIQEANIPIWLSTAEDRAGGVAPVAKSVTQFQRIVSPSWNRNAAALDLTGRYLCSTYAILQGLVVSAVDGSNVINISVGQGLADGIIELSSPWSSSPLIDDVYSVWLLQGEQVFLQINTTDPPDVPAVFLATVTVSGLVITHIDYSGVLYWFGMLFRQTADHAAPNDTPPTGIRVVTETLGGLYLWDGNNHRYIQPYQFGCSFPGSIGSNAKVGLSINQKCTLRQNSILCTGGCGTAPTNTTVFTLYRAGTALGVYTIAAGSFTATFTSAADVTINAGDLLFLQAPASADPSIADAAFTLAFTL